MLQILIFGDKHILSIYFKSDEINAIILMTFKYLGIEKKAILDGIKFFENKDDVIGYIRKEKLELIEVKELVEHKDIQLLKGLICKYLSGININLVESIEDLNIDLALQEKFPTRFSLDVIQNLMNLNLGEITTYSDIGNKIGSRAFRAIGNVLRNNPLPLIIPCHRVIKKSGDIGGFMGETSHSWQQNLKKELIEIEKFSST
ncbi:MAG: methylated-DNA--[protein]-cysteine S-methyltransferase [Promethearchaeota archaeon]